MLVAILAACLSKYLDAPYVLTTGLPPVTRITVHDESLMVDTTGGTFRLEGTGTAIRVESATPGEADDDAAAGTGEILAQDQRGRRYVVRGTSEPKLYRMDSSNETLIAEWIGNVTSMTFGNGGPFPKENLYLGRGDGLVVYLRPP